MTDYSNTVFTPKTTVPTRFTSKEVEDAVRRRWSGLKPTASGEPYLLVDGPPYANGNIHIGHALNKVLKDIVARMKRQRGFDVQFQPGWDCHGLPIEWAVEQEFRTKGLEKNQVSGSEFRARCRSFAQEWVTAQADQFKALGVSAEWSKPYLTMQPMREAQIMGKFHDLLRNGQVYQANKPVLWSAVEGTSMAEAEVEEKEHEVPTVWVRFPIVSGTLLGSFLLVWTTTPWSLPGNAAVVFGNDISYGLYNYEGMQYVVSDSSAASLFGEEGNRLQDVSADELKSMTVHAPFQTELSVPVFAADFVQEKTGTGLVHLGPSHSMDDWTAWRTQFGDAPYPQVVNPDGRIDSSIPMVGGLKIVQGKGYGPGNSEVVNYLAALNLLFKIEEQKITLPHSWRSGAMLITIATPQWFIDLSSLPRSVNEAVEFHPAFGRTRLESMLARRPDWVVSRQRMWGTPLGVFVNRETGNPLLDEGVLLRTLGMVMARGSDGWWDTPVEELLGDYNPEQYVRIDDVLDVWFDSACVPYFYDRPADLVLEGSDQSKGWFQSSYIVSALLTGRAPYKKVVTHGFVLDKDGLKMSKSKKNVTDPATIVSRYGADVLRLWVASADYTQDVRISEDTLKGCAEMHRKIRNTLRYLVGSLSDFDPSDQVDSLPDVEFRAMYQLLEFTKKMESHAVALDFSAYTRELNRYCVEDLSGFLLDIRKDVLYCDPKTSHTRKAYLLLLSQIYSVLIMYCSPIMPFTAEEMQSARFPDGVMACELPFAGLRNLSNPPQEWHDQWSRIMVVRDAANRDMSEARAAGAIKATTETIVFLKNAPAPPELMAEVLIVSEVKSMLDWEGSADLMVVRADQEGMSKCPRCWKYAPIDEPLELCERCEDAIS